MSAWQPIETAPKDGTTILILVSYGGKRRPAITHWNDHFQEWDRFLGESPYYMPFTEGVTHWMPIQEPPA